MGELGKCSYCYRKTPHLMFVEGNKISNLTFICSECSEREKFTIADLARVMGLSLESIMEIESLACYTVNLTEDSDGTEMDLGVRKLDVCIFCEKFLGRRETLVQHLKSSHPDMENLTKCRVGCGMYTNNPKHAADCGIWCPYEECNGRYPQSDQHFKEHKVLFCPFYACTEGFLPTNFDRFSIHIISQHLWQTRDFKTV